MSEISRRDAFTRAAGAFTIMKSSTAFGSQANSAVSFGIIGTGGRGTYVGTHMAHDRNARLTAICDIYPDRIDQAKTKLPGGDQARVYRNYHDLLDQADLDAVLISTPVYLHPEHFEAAVQAKKHVYCEKPAGANVAGVKRLLRAADQVDKTKTIQFGFQQRFSPEYLKALDLLRTGKLGDMKMMTSYWVLGGTPPEAFKSPYPLEEQRIRHWGAWMETSGGSIVEQDCHGVDTLNWFANSNPLKASGTGGLRYPIPYGDWTSDHHNITYTYPGGVEGWLISIKHTGGFRDVKEQFYGSKGMVETARTYFRWHGPTQTSPLKNADDLRDRSLIDKGESSREITIDAAESFFKSIVEAKPYNLSRAAADATLTSLLGRMAYERRREVTWEELLRSA
jgi:myo-inositol 2-dehydrogenase/D-chiro-inositol 1-dehydrogenase